MLGVLGLGIGRLGDTEERIPYDEANPAGHAGEAERITFLSSSELGPGFMREGRLIAEGSPEQLRQRSGMTDLEQAFLKFAEADHAA